MNTPWLRATAESGYPTFPSQMERQTERIAGTGRGVVVHVVPDLTPRQTRRVLDKLVVGDDHWEWGGTHDRLGYGWVSINNRKYPAHRVIYTLIRGAIPAGLVIDHLCRQPGCVNPNHLEAVTHRENVMRGNVPCAEQKCRRGHDKSNPYINPTSGARACRTCRYETNRRWADEHRERVRETNRRSYERNKST
jgi:hypothetical protein